MDAFVILKQQNTHTFTHARERFAEAAVWLALTYMGKRNDFGWDGISSMWQKFMTQNSSIVSPSERVLKSMATIMQ